MFCTVLKHYSFVILASPNICGFAGGRAVIYMTTVALLLLVTSIAAAVYVWRRKQSGTALSAVGPIGCSRTYVPALLYMPEVFLPAAKHHYMVHKLCPMQSLLSCASQAGTKAMHAQTHTYMHRDTHAQTHTRGDPHTTTE